MNNEIKVGDKVRVSKNAQEIFVYGLNPLWFTEESTVIGTHPDGVLIKFDANNHLTTGLPIPTKYLIKVEDEPTFKVGDKVRIKPNAKEFHQGYQNGYIWLHSRDKYVGKVYRIKEIWERTNDYILDLPELITWVGIDLEPYTEPTAPTIKVGDMVRCKSPLRLKNSTDDDFIGTVTDAENGWFIVHMNNGAVFQTCNAADLELVQPKEQTEETSPNVNHSDIDIDTIVARGYISDPNSFFKCDWDAYTADLAKEIAVKITNKKMDNTPLDVADYAVSVAKAVVDNLKKK